MPIRADLKPYYGKQWRELIRPRILKRAGGEFDGKHRYLGGARCERCGKPDRSILVTYSGRAFLTGRPRMAWRPLFAVAEEWRDESGRRCAIATSGPPRQGLLVFQKARRREIFCILTVAHLDHDPGNNRDSNLKALCQWCHLNYDKLHHKQTRCQRKDARRPLLREAACS